MKRRYQTASEKQRAYRERKRNLEHLGSSLSGGEPESSTEGFGNEVAADIQSQPLPQTLTLTKTDKLFAGYVLGRTKYQRHCRTCEKRFETHLELVRFCSPGCMDRFLAEHSTMP